MSPMHFKLQHSESVVVQAAAQIYAAYISSGRVGENDADQWMERSIEEAILIARGVDDAVISDDEVDSTAAQCSGGITVGRLQTKRNRHQ